MGRTVQNTLKGGWNRNEGRGNKDLKKWVQAGLRVGCLKKRRAGTTFETMI